MGRGVVRRGRWLVALAVASLVAGCAQGVEPAGSPPATAVPRGAASPVATGGTVEAGAIAPPPAAFAGPVPAAVPVALPDAPAGGGGVWSVVVGIDDYPGGAHDLRSAVNDAAEVELLLDRAGVPREQRLHLVDGQATGEVVRHALDWLVAHAGPDATAVVFLAGHVRQLGEGVEAFIAADGGLVADHEVAQRLGGLRAARTWIVLATCFAGGFTEVLAPGRILTGAAPAGRLAYESIELGRSYLVEYLVRRALLEGRATTVEAAFTWAYAAIAREHPRRTPVQLDELPGDLGLRAAPVPARPAPPPPAPAPRPASPPPSPTTTAPPPEESCGVTLGTVLHCPED